MQAMGQAGLHLCQPQAQLQEQEPEQRATQGENKLSYFKGITETCKYLGHVASFKTFAGEVILGKISFHSQPSTRGPPSSARTVEAWKFVGNNRKGFSSLNVPNQPVDCLVQGIRLVCGPATVGQVTKLKDLLVAAQSTMYIFVFFTLSMICKCLPKMWVDKEM